MKRDEEWREAISQGTQGRIRDHRKALGLTVEELSDRTRTIGFEIPRSTITNIESQRKAHVAVHEVLILAEALEVPPAALIAGTAEGEVEILPGRTMTTGEAQEWISGVSGIKKARIAIRKVEEAMSAALKELKA